MTWQLVISGDIQVTVTLPNNPTRAEIRNKAIIESLELPGDIPFLLGLGKEGQTLTIEGTLQAANQASASLYIESNYIFPLTSGVFQCVQVNADDNRYNGQYVLSEFTWSEEAGAPGVYRYSMEFIKGSEMMSI
jgi:hypothetical protein